MNELTWETADEIALALAKRVQKIRRRRKISQEALSSKCGVSLGSVKRFETTGLIAFLSLVKIAMALDISDEIKELFKEVPYLTIEEVIRENR
ncbi:MAG: helix-turn-helix transcriptional regulator [Lachnospiraceae bacterium]|nr:helix-turn-helix transcriptional regulator [Lachnospiraceae bacterium]